MKTKQSFWKQLSCALSFFLVACASFAVAQIIEDGSSLQDGGTPAQPRTSMDIPDPQPSSRNQSRNQVAQKQEELVTNIGSQEIVEETLEGTLEGALEENLEGTLEDEFLEEEIVEQVVMEEKVSDEGDVLEVLTSETVMETNEEEADAIIEEILKRESEPVVLVEAIEIMEVVEEGVEETNLEADEPANEELLVKDARDTMFEAMILVQDNMYEEAIPKLEWVLEEDPTLLGAWETLGWAYWLTGREDETLDLWSRLVEIAPNEPMGHNLMGKVATRRGELDLAKESYLKSLELNPTQYEIQFSLAQVELWDGNWEAATERLQKLFTEDPERTDIQIELAWALYGYEQYEESLEHWNDIIEVIPGHTGFLVARADVHLLLGMLTESEADATMALEVDENNLRALNILISLSMQNNRPQETVTRLIDLQDRMETTENRIKVAQQRAIYMNAIGNENPTIFSQEQVIQAAEDAWDLDRDNVSSALFYGESLTLGKEFEQAGDIFDYVLDNLNHLNDRARYGKLESFLGRAMINEAEEQLIDNLRVFNGESPFRHTYWARIHFARGDFQLGLKALERLEREGARGSVFTLLYHGISPSEFSDMPSVRQLREQVITLQRDGWEFMTVSEIPVFFEGKSDPPPAEMDRPWLNRMVESVKYSWTAEKEAEPEILSDYSPEKKVVVTFDGGLRKSFRYATIVADEIDEKFTMFVGVGDVLSLSQRYISQFPEIREYVATDRWEIQSQLWDAGQLFPIDEEGKMGISLPNRIFLEEKDRMETLQGYQKRLRKEFSTSREVLARELGMPIKSVNSVSYPYGEIGRENTTNIDLFDVTRVILNESAIAYEQGFVQNQFGYTVKGDNPLLYKRYEPNRHASGRQVLREAYLQHPVFVARRMRAEIAALNGRYDMAMENVELLRRDGYPEEDLRELTKFVDRNLARLVRLPDGVEDTSGDETTLKKSAFLKIENPYIGVDGRTVRSNDIIDEEELGIFAGVNLNRRVAFQARFAQGQIEQNFNSPTTRVFETFTSRTGSSNRTFNQVVNGQTFRVTENSSFTDSSSFQSNIVEEINYKADFERVEGLFSYIHDSGSFTILKGGLFKLELDRNGAFDSQENEFVYGIEHQWRPFPNMDFVALYNHGIVPSAIDMVTYDQLAFRPVWRITDRWHATGIGSFAFYDDNNSFINTELENLWMISEKLDIWAGLHSAISTTDEDSDLYWTPFWEQRHFGVLEIRRSYPGLTTSLRGHLGFQKEAARDEEIQEFQNLQATAAEQGGFAAGDGPDEDWGKLLGFSANINKTFDWGLEINGSFLVNATRTYTEHNVLGSILYRF